MKLENKISIHEGSLILVNAYHPCEADCKDLVPVSARVPSCCLKTEAKDMLCRLLDAIDEKEEIIPVSGWRSYTEQTEIWDSSIAENGMEFTREYVALPGCSEHQTGLAIDLALISEQIDFIRPDFPHEGVCEAFRRTMNDFGFVERYPEGKEAITGIAYEPWHFRYVGIPHAAVMTDHGWTLEEYVDQLRNYPFSGDGLRAGCCGRGYRISFLEEAELSALSGLRHQNNISISGNNVDGFIVTEQDAL